MAKRLYAEAETRVLSVSKLVEHAVTRLFAEFDAEQTRAEVGTGIEAKS